MNTKPIVIGLGSVVGIVSVAATSFYGGCRFANHAVNKKFKNIQPVFNKTIYDVIQKGLDEELSNEELNDYLKHDLNFIEMLLNDKRIS